MAGPQFRPSTSSVLPGHRSKLLPIRPWEAAGAGNVHPGTPSFCAPAPGIRCQPGGGWMQVTLATGCGSLLPGPGPGLADPHLGSRHCPPLPDGSQARLGAWRGAGGGGGIGRHLPGRGGWSNRGGGLGECYRAGAHTGLCGRGDRSRCCLRWGLGEPCQKPPHRS